MEIIQPLPAKTLSADNKRHCIRIKARIKIHGEDRFSERALHAKPSHQAYCETVTSSRPQSPDIFTTPPTHSEPFQPVQSSITPTYTARIVTRKRAVSRASTGTAVSALSRHGIPPTGSSTPIASDSKQQVVIGRTFPNEAQGSKNRHDSVSGTAIPRGGHLEGMVDVMSRNHTLSLSQGQRANTSPQAIPQIFSARMPLKQKRYGMMEYHPLPPLPPSHTGTAVVPSTTKHDTNKITVTFSRVEIRRNPPQSQDCTSVPHLSCIDTYAPPPRLPSAAHHPNHTQTTIAGHERPPSKSSKRTVTFSDATTLSSRGSSPERYSHVHSHSLQQSANLTSFAQIPSTLRLYRSHDSLLATHTALPVPSTSSPASRRTAPKDFKHKYIFGQRPNFPNTTPAHPGLARPTDVDHKYNPRLSTSKAQYRSLATLPRPLPSSLRIPAPRTSQNGPRRPPWGSLERLEEQRSLRMDARERDQARVYRAQTLSEATTARGSVDSFGQAAMKRQVEGYRAQVVSVYPDMAFDGNAGKGGRSNCCCVVM